MSLNGLDDPSVTEAYQAALAEAGGWFLLKYVSRDAIDIHGRGTGGVPEARAAIDAYENKSPLYGFLIYRRRKVLVKYIPEGTSRLVQARVTVHFQSFEDKFKPHDTVIIIATSTDLTDIALSAACSLHSAADTSRSSGGSAQLRKSKLDEIVEDPKERPSYDARAASIDKPAGPPLPALPAARKSAEEEKELPPLPDDHARPGTRDSHLGSPPPVASRKAAAILGIPLATVSSVSIDASGQRPSSPAAAGDTASLYAPSIGSLGRSDYHADYLAYLDALEGRSSSSTTRPSLSDLYAGLYQKPKVRLGPRPSADGAARSSASPRPVSSLPQGLRTAPRKELHSANRPAPKPAAIDPIIRLPPPPPIPEVPQVSEIIRPSSRAASVKSMPTTLASQAGKKTPEKKRLQKAMEMRKKQLAAARQAAAPVEQPPQETKAATPPAVEPEAVSAAAPQLSLPVFESGHDGEGDFAHSMTRSEDAPTSSGRDESQADAQGDPYSDPGPAKDEGEQPPGPDPEPIPAPVAGQQTLELPSDFLTTQGRGSPGSSTPSASSQIADATNPLSSLGDITDALNQRGKQTGPSALSALDDLIAQDTPITSPHEKGIEAAVFPDQDVGPTSSAAKQAEPDTVRNPARASADHLKADSGVQVEVRESPPNAEADSAVDVHPTVGGDDPKGATPGSPSRVQSSSELSAPQSSSVPVVAQPDKADDDLAEETAQKGSNFENPREQSSTPTLAAAVPQAAQEEAVAESAERAGEPQTSAQAEPSSEGSERDDAASKGGPLSPLATSVAPLEPIRKRRQGMLRPISIAPTTPGTGTEESEFDMSDDDLMSELQNAQVQEAKPMSVTKSYSPVDSRFPRINALDSPRSVATSSATERGPNRSPAESRSPKLATNDSPDSDEKSSTQRRPSQPLLKVEPEDSPSSITRSASAGQLSKITDSEGSITVAKSVNVSSGISQRIKALARNSGSSDQLALERVPSRESTGKSIAALRKSSLGSGATRPFSETPPALPASARERIVSLTRDGATAAASSTRSSHIAATTPPRDSIHAVYNVSQQTGRPESISVTARIVRDDRTQKPSLAAPSQVTPLELHESPLVIEHHHKRRTSVPASPARLQTPAAESSPEQFENSSPVSPSRDRGLMSSITALPRTPSDNWRNSFALGRSRQTSDAKSPTSMVKSSSSTSLGTTGSRDSDPPFERRGSISSRMLKRMSNSISLGRKTITQIVGPTLEEPTSPLPGKSPEQPQHLHQHQQTPAQTSYVTEIGDLNVQLPDTLLWKRRWVELDEQGDIVVKMSKSNEMANTKSNARTFHMSELKRPFLPDQERQEMPYSVVIDFVDGRTMQCACETAGGQLEVLRVLQDAHQTYAQR